MIRRTITTTLLATGVLALLASPAAAHITASPNTAEAGGRAATTLVVPHGCEDSPTTVVEVAIPDEVEGVTPEQVAGWTAEITDESVIWTAESGSELPSDQFRGFGLRLVLPDTPGEVLWFPTVQTCEDGEESWIEIPEDVDGWGDLDYPAPYVELIEASGDDHGAGDDAASSDDDADDVADGADAAVDDADDAAADDDELAVDLAASEEAGTDGLVYLAIGVGVLGVVLGGAGLAAARTRG